jgi:hypothetical protein
MKGRSALSNPGPPILGRSSGTQILLQVMGYFSNKFKVSTAAISANGRYRAFATGTRILNGGLTFAFGFMWGAYIIPTGHPTLSAILGGIAFALIYDVAAFGWDAAGKRKGISPEQRLISDNMASFSMWSSTAISAVQLILTTPLVDLSSMHEGIGMAALALTTLLLAAHFVQAFSYAKLSPEAVKARIDAEQLSTLEAMYRAQRIELSEKIQERVAERMVENIDRFAELETEKEWKRLMTDMGHAQEARPQVQGKDKKAGPPTPPQDAIIDDGTATATVAEKDIIDLDEVLTGNARAAQEQNLNMAAG